jgi:hypothetical protein
MSLRERRGVDGTAAAANVEQSHRQSRYGGANRKRRQVAAGGKARPYPKRRRGSRGRPKGNEIVLIGIAEREISAALFLRREIVRRERLLTQYEDIVSIASHRT